MHSAIDFVANALLIVILIFTLASLVFPKLYSGVRQYFRPDELHFENERPDRERQVAMVIIIVLVVWMLWQIRC
jgi:hypothetical protein